nr:DNA polymerase I [uncultured Mediterranean phage uvMED]
MDWIKEKFSLEGHPKPEMYACDFEYFGGDGEIPSAVCLVYCNLRTMEFHRVWRDELLTMKECPFPVDESSVVFSFFWPAEGSCFEALGWSQPHFIVDLYAEFRCLTNGRKVPCGSSLLGAMTYYGCPSMATEMKETMRDLILSGGPWSADEKEAIFGYCEADVKALAELVEVMEPELDCETAFYRGRYMEAVSAMEHRGIPIDVQNFEDIQEKWPLLLEKLIKEVDKDYHVYDGTTFRMDKFGSFLDRENIQWPRTPVGRFDVSDATFRAKAEQYPQLQTLRELRSTISGTKNLLLTVGSDGRNRCMLSPFRSKTGRNQPSNTKFIYGPHKWIRHLIKPNKDQAVAYIDWSQQEFGIGAKLSGDEGMMQCYVSSDPYLEFAKLASAVPPDATRESHPTQRQQFKVCSLGVLFGLTGEGMARKLGIPSEGGRQLLRLHKNVFPKFWKWQERVVANALINMEMSTVLGWRMYVPPRTDLMDRNKTRTLSNFPLQGNGSEMLRVAVINAHEMGVELLAPIHDALLVQSTIWDIDQTVEKTRQAMSDASATVLDGFRLNTDVEIIKWPDRYSDERGAELWSKITNLLPTID